MKKVYHLKRQRPKKRKAPPPTRRRFQREGYPVGISLSHQTALDRHFEMLLAPVSPRPAHRFDQSTAGFPPAPVHVFIDESANLPRDIAEALSAVATGPTGAPFFFEPSMPRKR